MINTGAVVDATLNAAPISITNKDGERDSEIDRPKKGNQWHVSMKAHIGVDADSVQVFFVIGSAICIDL